MESVLYLVHPLNCGCVLNFIGDKNSDGVCSSPTIWDGFWIPGDNLVELSGDKCLSHMTGRGKGRVGNGGTAVSFLEKGALLGFS